MGSWSRSIVSKQGPLFYSDLWLIANDILQYRRHASCYLQDLDSFPFAIYMLFTGSWQSPFFNLHAVYRILKFSLFQCCLQDFNCVLFLNLYVIYMISLRFVCSILSYIYMFKSKNLRDLYMIIQSI